VRRPGDPRWIGLATRVYAACLWFYPPSLREAHGTELLQAFRDRCRETVAGKRTFWSLGLELVPDLVGSASQAQFDAARNHGRASLPALVLLAGLALALASQPRWSGAALDVIKGFEAVWNMWQEDRHAKQRDAAVMDVANRLVARGDAASIAIAARLHDSLAEQQRWYVDPAFGVGWRDAPRPRTLYFSEQRARAGVLAGSVAASPGSTEALTLATAACHVNGGCNQDLLLRRLLARDPDNAFAWMLEFKRAAQRDDLPRMAAAVEGAGHARRYESYAGRMTAAVLAEANRGSDGTDLLPILAFHAANLEAVPGDDFRHDLRLHCSLGGSPSPTERRWILVHPEARANCLHLAGLMANSNDLLAATWGWRQLRRAGMVDTPGREASYRDTAWLDRNNVVGYEPGERHRFTPWTPERWAAWSATWSPGDGQIPALRRWLRAQGKPHRAPAGFTSPERI
jgi:hypothetical protein